MSVVKHCSYCLLAPLLLAVIAMEAMAQGRDDLDVTIRVIDRQDTGVEAFINRIELPVQLPDTINRAARREGEPREQVEGHRQRSEERHQRGADMAESARERRREARKELQRQQREARDD